MTKPTARMSSQYHPDIHVVAYEQLVHLWFLTDGIDSVPFLGLHVYRLNIREKKRCLPATESSLEHPQAVAPGSTGRHLTFPNVVRDHTQ
jgi:hypothetical protein